MESKNELRERLKTYLATYPAMSQKKVASSIGRSPTLVSLWLRNEYTGNNEELESLISDFLDREAERRARPRTNLKFVHTIASRAIFEAASLCHHDGEIGVVTSDAGIGKTWAVKEYQRQHRDVILIEADPGDSAFTTLSQVHQGVGMDGASLPTPMFLDCVQRLQGSGRLIIVDEAENLQKRALEILRRIHDKAGIGILLIGLPRLYDNLRGRRGDYAQLYSRVASYVKLERPTEEDVVRVMHEILPDEPEVAREFYRLAQGRMRLLEKLVRVSMRMSKLNKRPIDREIIKAASETLMF